MNTSLWVESAPPQDRVSLGDPLNSHTSADIAIVGAGYTGLWSAYYLNQINPSLKICIVDANYPGFGASGRNGGWVSALFPAQLTAISRLSSRDNAIRMHHAMTANVQEIGLVAAEHGWDIGWAHGGTVVAARTPVQLERARASVEDMGQWGLSEDLRFLDKHEILQLVHVTDALGGTFTPHCAAINPFLLARNLAQHLAQRGITFFENTHVNEISPGIVRAQGGSVRAPVTIRATEGYTRSLQGHSRTLAPVYSLMLATEPLSLDQWAEIGLNNRETFSDYRNLIIYGQRTSDNRIAFGGRGAPYFFRSKITASQDHNERVHRELWRVLTDMFPVLHDTHVTHTWGGPLGIARDWWASCGFDPRTGQAWSGGYVGDGVGTSHLGGKTLAHLITGVESNLTTLPWVNHRSPNWEPEPLRWLGANAGLQVMQRADSYENRTGKPAKSAQIMGRLLGH